MSWIRCNSCFHPPSADLQLAITTCGHVVCSTCFKKGKQGECLICKAKCDVAALTDKSSPEVKALFEDISTVATKHFTEIGKVLAFQARHRKRLLSHYRERNQKLEEALVKMKQEMQQMKHEMQQMKHEMQQMSKKLSEQSAYIAKLESALQQHQSAKAPSLSHMNISSHTLCGQKSVLQIPFNSPMSMGLRSATTNLRSDSMEVDGRTPFRKPDPVPRLSLISPPQDGRMGTIPQRSTSQNTRVSQSARSATVSRFTFQSMLNTPEISHGGRTGWNTPVYKPASPMSWSCPPP